MNPRAREHGVVRHRAVALGEEEAVAVGVVGVPGVDLEHVVVEGPDHIERRRGAGVVLLVAGHQCH